MESYEHDQNETKYHNIEHECAIDHVYKARMKDIMLKCDIKDDHLLYSQWGIGNMMGLSNEAMTQNAHRFNEDKKKANQRDFRDSVMNITRRYLKLGAFDFINSLKLRGCASFNIDFEFVCDKKWTASLQCQWAGYIINLTSRPAVSKKNAKRVVIDNFYLVSLAITGNFHFDHFDVSGNLAALSIST